MNLRRLIATTAISGFAAGVLAQDFPDLADMPGLPEQPAVQVDLNPLMLSLISQTAFAANPDAAHLLDAIRSMRVRVYSTLEDPAALIASLDRASVDLLRANWQQIVHIRDDGDIRLYAQGDEELITGLAGMIVSDGEAIFVDVTGGITPAQLAQLASIAGSPEILGAVAGFVEAPR